MVRIGLVGLGNMGLPVSRRLATAFPDKFSVWARRSSSASPLAGVAGIASTVDELARNNDVILSLLPDIDDLSALMVENGAFDDAGQTLLIICSTSSPDAVRGLGAELLRRTDGRVRVVDAPVSGGTDGAEAGTLSIMVGGDDDDVARAMSILAPLGTARHLGPLGAGEIAKACNQMIVASTILALGEATAVAARAGLDVDAMWDLLSQGYAGSRVLTTRMRRLVDEDYTVSGPAKFMVKDLSFALEEAERTQTRTDLLRLLRDQFTQLTADGFGEQDISVTRAFVESR